MLGKVSAAQYAGEAVWGRVVVAENVIFASWDGCAWSVIFNGVAVDEVANRCAAMDLVSRLGQALRANEALFPQAAERRFTVACKRG